MGIAKYHEDDLNIFEERMYYKNAPDTLSIIRSTYKPKKPVYTIMCPLCRCGISSSKALTDHIYNMHGRKYEFIYLNSTKLDASQYRVSRIYSLKLYCFYDTPQHITITDDFDRKYYIDTVKGKYEYDVSNVLKGKLFSYLKIDIPDRKDAVEIQQFLDMDGASIDNILQNRYVSSLFDVRISDDTLAVNECLTYMKMLIHEGEDIEPFIIRVDNMHFDYSRDLIEVFWYYYLNSGSIDESYLDDKKVKAKTLNALISILQGDYSKADELLKTESRNDNDSVGCRLILSILVNDEMTIAYNEKRYSSYGIIGMIVNILLEIRNYENKIHTDITNELKELSLFSQYPLVASFMEFYEAEAGRCMLSKQSYDLLRDSSPIVSLLFCRGISDDSVVEKILKSNIKIHKKSQLIKNEALDKEFSWINRRISVNDGDVYRRKLNYENEKRKFPFSEEFLDSFPYDNEILITALGGEKAIGASCFVISFKGYNIMIDAGLNPRKRNDAAYPELDEWEGRIDLILLSHAHIDHSGGVPKAHAMWKDARILMTKPTKVLLKFIYSDMARVKNGIVDDFEIENVNITKEVMEDTFRAISTVDYQDRIKVSEDIEICFHKAGHIVGSAMIELKIAGKTILYTGDYTDYDQNFVAGLNYDDLPKNVDYLITEATYVVNGEFDIYQQSENLKNMIKQSVDKNQSVLLPAASIGRSQELVCILGDMIENGDIPEDYTLYIAGMAIPTTTQLIPFFNSTYEDLLTHFVEFDGNNYPEEKSIVIASSGTLKKGSASYKIEQYWKRYFIRHITILGGFADEDTEYEYEESARNDRYRMPLSTHVSQDGIYKLICQTEPKIVSIVHRGNNSQAGIHLLEQRCRQEFDNDIQFIDILKNEKMNAFNLLEYIMEENINGTRN